MSTTSWGCPCIYQHSDGTYWSWSSERCSNWMWVVLLQITLFKDRVKYLKVWVTLWRVDMVSQLVCIHLFVAVVCVWYLSGECIPYRHWGGRGERFADPAGGWAIWGGALWHGNNQHQFAVCMLGPWTFKSSTWYLGLSQIVVSF